MVEDLMLDLPTDPSQVPDIIINFYCNQGQDHDIKHRIGYIRIVASDVSAKNPKPQWMRIKTPFSDNNGKSPGQILMNC